MSLVEAWFGQNKKPNTPTPAPRTTTEHIEGGYRQGLVVKLQDGRSVAATPEGDLTPIGRAVIKLQQATKSAPVSRR